MNQDNSQKEHTSEKPPKRKFWQNLLIMDSGDLKKILSLSSLMLSFVILFIYLIAYVFLMPLIDKLIASGPVILVSIAESLIPAIIGTAAVMLTWPIYKDKRVLPSAYLWLVFFAFAILLIVSINLSNDPEAKKFFLYIFLWDVLPALIIGNLAAWIKYKNFLWK